MVSFVTELDKETYQNFINKDFVLVDVWAPWCGPCKLIGPIVDQISVDFNGQLSVGKLEADSNRDIVVDLGIRSIPTILLFKNGQEVARKVGSLDKQKLTALINEHIS
jgi:thioredoxin 1